jgi:hypothetical protein
MDRQAAKDRTLEAAQESPEDQDFLSAAVLNCGDVFHNDRFTNPVIPAQAGIQDTSIPATATLVWMPACAGMTYGSPDE